MRKRRPLAFLTLSLNIMHVCIIKFLELKDGWMEFNNGDKKMENKRITDVRLVLPHTKIIYFL